MLFQLFGGLSTSLSVDMTAGKFQFSHGGLEFLYFFVDAEKPLDHTLRATCVRIGGGKTAGEFDVHCPYVATRTWDHEGNFHVVCMRLSYNLAGKKVSSVEDVTQLLERLKVSPGGGHISDGGISMCVGQLEVSRRGEFQTPSTTKGTTPGLSTIEVTTPESDTHEYWWNPELSDIKDTSPERETHGYW